MGIYVCWSVLMTSVVLVLCISVVSSGYSMSSWIVGIELSFLLLLTSYYTMLSAYNSTWLLVLLLLVLSYCIVEYTRT